ncbi:MAG TPA: phosphatase PAP2 family protein [Gaiellales bacterium]|nr:phosphatase PAP2 family protein [Gaiellales bacterium]
MLPKGWPDFLLQLGLFAVADLLYEISRTLAKGDLAVAFVHARDVVTVEKTVGIFTELDLQHWALARPWVLDVANITYFHAHFAVTTCFMFWLYLRRNHHYYFVRNIVFSAMALALIGYVLFPTAPPRMLTDLGFIDTLEKTADVNFNTGAVSLLSNPFAAVPSVHTCFALIIGASCFFLVRRPAIRFIWLFYPCLIVFSIVATGNHFWLDAILGACLAGVALGVAWTIERFHPTLPASARHRLRLDPAS